MSTIKANTISPIGSTLTLGAPVAGLSVASGITVGGIGYFSSGVSFASTTDTAGVARFASGVTFSGTIDCVGVARFASTSTFTGLVTLTGGATSAAVISCGTAPTQGQHLVNKTYVDGQMIGVGQSWQFNMTRSNDTNYTNNTGRPIGVAVGFGGGGRFYINDNLVWETGNITNLACGCFHIIPNGSTYRAAYNATSPGSGTPLRFWHELR